MRENRPSGLMRGGKQTVFGLRASQSVVSRLLYMSKYFLIWSRLWSRMRKISWLFLSGQQSVKSLANPLGFKAAGHLWPLMSFHVRSRKNISASFGTKKSQVQILSARPSSLGKMVFWSKSISDCANFSVLKSAFFSSKPGCCPGDGFALNCFKASARKV